ncbi:MAG TPA: metallophosphoesterase family protein [Sandaracinaceae bacterium LLY-WYZ-13_1]|nr:metallophosphoesterase family protein [Sandaracinaceae bacterium LLY-WYZ-13_1]
MAVLGDVHANLEALEAVLAAVRRVGADRVVGLGDVVGYGARPRECVERMAVATDACVLGNHDHGAIADAAAAGTHPSARQVMRWTRAQLADGHVAWLAARPALTVLRPPGVAVAHGCYLNRTYHRGYVTSTMLEANLDAVAARDDLPSIALCGHTHVPMVGWRGADGALHERAPREGTVRWDADARVVLVNPGAVGQPRDGDPRAAFAVLDAEARSCTVHRVPYDVGAAAEAIRAAGLPDDYADRLLEGR